VKVLIADDDRLQILVLTRILAQEGHDVQHAHDGVEAWDLLQGEPFDLVISDWMMPRMDGPELCRRIRSRVWDSYVFIILLTGRNAKEALVEGLSAGADEFVTKPIRNLELTARLRVVARIRETEQKLRQEKERTVEAYRQLDEDLQIAVRVHRELFPSPIHLPQLEVAWRLHPATMLGGDFLTYHICEDRYLHIVSADVCGHGLAAALHAVALKEALNPIKLLGFTDPALVVAELNRQFLTFKNFYCTLFYLVLDLCNGKARFCQAGHPSPLLLRVGKPAVELGESGFPVGLLEQAVYESEEIELGTDFRLLCYSDGVLDCLNLQGEIFGRDRLLQAAIREGCDNIDAWLDGIEAALKAWCGEARFDDDISILAVSFSGGRA
jgi:sigma-B regulation protein RsbU (phosphoserine phosphatase)